MENPKEMYTCYTQFTNVDNKNNLQVFDIIAYNVF